MKSRESTVKDKLMEIKTQPDAYEVIEGPGDTELLIAEWHDEQGNITREAVIEPEGWTWEKTE